MNNNAKKKKRNFLKSIVPVLSFFMIITAILLFVYTIDNKKFNKGRVVYDTEYTMRVLYLVMNEDEVPSDITMNKTFDPDYSEYPIGILSTSSSMIPLTKKGDYLYADLDKFTNVELLKKETDYVFTWTNNNGEVIDGCEYNKEDNTVKVPVSYFKDTKVNPIQLEVQTLMKEDTYNNLVTEVNVKKFTTKKVKAVNNALSVETTVDLGKFGPGELTDEDVHVYVNNSEIAYDENMYEVKNGKLTIYLPPLQIRKLDVKVDYTISSASAMTCGFSGSTHTCDHATDDLTELRGIKVSAPINYSSWDLETVARLEENVREQQVTESNPPARRVKHVTYKVGINEGNGNQIIYCDDQGATTGCSTRRYINTWDPNYANWSYTYTPFGGYIQGDNISYETYDANGHYEVLFTYKLQLSTLLNSIQSGLTVDDPTDIGEAPIHTYNSQNYNQSWLAFYCTHFSTGSQISDSNPYLGFVIMVVADTSNSVTLKIQAENRYRNQAANAYIRFYWDDVPTLGGLRIKKTDNNGNVIAGLPITIVNINDSTETHTVNTNSSGIAEFTGLTLGNKYKVYENCSASVTYGGRTGTLNNLDVSCNYNSAANAWTNGGSYVTAVEESGGTYTMSTMTNNVIQVGLRVKKTDDAGNAVQGLEITAENKANSSDRKTATTDANGIATFANLTSGAKYKFYENCNSTVTVNGSVGTLNALGIECTYPSSNPYTGTSSQFVPTQNYASTTIATISDVRYRYCVAAKKVKGPAKNLESNVTFRLTIPQNVCSGASGNISKTTGSSGRVEFVGLGYCKGTATLAVTDQTHINSIDGDVSKNVSFIRSVVKVTKTGGITYRGKTYAKGAEIAIAQSDWETYKNDVEETCPTTNDYEFRDKGYILKWTKLNQTHKSNNNGTAMSGVTFTVSKGGSQIRVLTSKANYTDIEGTTKSCYVWTSNTGSGTTTSLVSDSNGEVCISNLPNSESYTISEVATNYYNNSSITLTSKEKFSDYSSSNYNNYEYLIDWNKIEYKNNKTTNSNGKLSGTKFSVKDSQNNAVKTKPTKETVYDKNGTSKSCYVVDLNTSANNTNSVFESDNNGYTCIMGLKGSETYTIEETTPSKYYTFSNSRSTTETSKLLFNNNDTKTMNNCTTEVKITKTTTELSNASDSYKRIVYGELQKLTFNVLDSNNNVLSFKYNSTSGRYEYVNAINELSGSSETGSTALRLLNGVNVDTASLSSINLDILINYLPVGTYTLREASSVSCASSSSTASSGSNCTCTGNTPGPGGSTTEESNCSNMGYAHVPDITFTVSNTNNGTSVTCDKQDNSTKVSLTNKPTKVKFTKKDFYGYYDNVDEVNFENDEEIEAFDNIVFRVRKASTISSGVTSDDNSNFEWFYRTSAGEYRLDVLKKCNTEGQVVGGYTCTQNLHTENGNINIGHLCKCESYIIEEYSVPDGTVFTLPKAENNTCSEGYLKVNKNGVIECHPQKAIKVCDCDDSNPESSPPVIIEDLPTKQVFIKKDLKYNTIITDQRTTFEVFLTNEDAASNGRKCNPYDATSKARDCIQVYFSNRTVLSDEADGSYSYRMVSDANASNKIKDLHVDPRTGKLILRYLPAFNDREYVLMETASPKGYDLPKGEKSVTRFKVVSDTINVEVSNVPNKPSKVIIGKYDASTGQLIPGVKFKIYKVNNYDENLTAMMQSMTAALEFKTIRDGSYEYREIFDTDVITTCTNRDGNPCSNIGGSLVDDAYDTSAIASSDNNVTIKEGQALIQYLDTNTYYVLEEIEAPEGYKLPERESDRYTLFYIPENEEVTKETKIYNTESYFTFFKYDEFNELKDGAVFKLQKLNKDKIYEDVPLEDVSTENTKIYKVSSTSENYEMTTLNGQATIYRLTEGQYRVIEVKAPEGYELPKKTYNVVTFLVDREGNTYGSNVIANKKKTERYEIIPKAEAELIVNIQTGRTIIRYGLIITGILGLISLLIYIRKKISR